MAEEKPQIEVVDKPEYSDMILNDIRFHGNEHTNPKGWHTELVRAAKFHKDTRLYGDQTNIYQTQEGHFILEQRLPLSQEQLKIYNEAAKSGKQFKLYVRKEGVLVSFDNSIKERVASVNKKAGYEMYTIPHDFYAKLSTFDVQDGVAIIKLIIS